MTKKILPLLLVVCLNSCETLFKSSVSIVYSAGGAVLLSSASVSASINSVSQSISQSSASSIPKKEEGGDQEYGIPQDENSENQPKPKEKWTDLDARFVKDVSDLTIIHWKQGKFDDDLSIDIQRRGYRLGILTSDQLGLGLVGIGRAMQEMGIDENQFYTILKNLREPGGLYGKNSLVYGYKLTL